jgi:hypothetical protein
LAKFAALRFGGDAATHVATVIVAHSRPEHGASADLDRFGSLALVDSSPWDGAGARDRWSSPRWPGYEFEVRVFACPVDGLSEWWGRFEPLLRARGWYG